MNADSMKNDATSAEYSSVEQRPTINNQQGENSTHNYTCLEEIVMTVNELNETTMTPSTLYISFFFVLIIIICRIFSLGRIRGGQHIDLQQLWVHLLYSQV